MCALARKIALATNAIKRLLPRWLSWPRGCDGLGRLLNSARPKLSAVLRTIVKTLTLQHDQPKKTKGMTRGSPGKDAVCELSLCLLLQLLLHADSRARRHLFARSRVKAKPSTILEEGIVRRMPGIVFLARFADFLIEAAPSNSF